MTQAASEKRLIDGLSPESPAEAAQRTSDTGHKLPVLDLDPRTFDRALACVHCGLCLPACPTYTENGLEADSPRGRIMLMRGMAEGKVQPTDAVIQHLDLCLDCRACETACPSGVVYHELIEETRERLNKDRPKTLVDRLVEGMFFHVFPYPWRLKLAMLPPRLLQKVGLWKPLVTQGPLRKLLPAKLDKMQQMLPEGGPLFEKSLLDHYPADPQSLVDGKPKAVVGFFAGCVGSVVFQQVNRDSIRLLQKAGCEVLVPRDQQCCGAIHHHGGRWDVAKQMARANIDAFMTAEGKAGPQVDYVVNNAAGCGAMLVDYHHLLRDDADYAERAEQFEHKVRDISVVLSELGLPRPEREVDLTVTYHDACHLAHAQKITEEPRHLLNLVPGIKLVPLPESDMCCGAAGTYNLSQPQMARQLAERKLANVKETGARVCVTGNVGCAMQIQSEAGRLGMDLKVKHPVTVLAEAYFGETR